VTTHWILECRRRFHKKTWQVVADSPGILHGSPIHYNEHDTDDDDDDGDDDDGDDDDGGGGDDNNNNDDDNGRDQGDTNDGCA
jgi:hypothetical protein